MEDNFEKEVMDDEESPEDEVNKLLMFMNAARDSECRVESEDGLTGRMRIRKSI